MLKAGGSILVKYTATTESYTYGHTLSLHDALPIWKADGSRFDPDGANRLRPAQPPMPNANLPLLSWNWLVTTYHRALSLTTVRLQIAAVRSGQHRRDDAIDARRRAFQDRKSTRLNSSH